jgi:hypothetical protein
MEHLFSPCTRLHDILESQGRVQMLRGWGAMPELNLDVSTNELLSAERAFTYADLHAMIGTPNTVVWLTPNAAIASIDGIITGLWGERDEAVPLNFTVDDKRPIVALAHSPENLLEICDIVLRLLAASVVHSVRLRKGVTRDGDVTINAPALAYLTDQCQSLKVLILHDLALDENHCRALGDYSRPGLEIELICCKLTSTGATALVEVLGRNQGPTKLDHCDFDNFVLADGLRGNSRLKSFRQTFSEVCDVGNRQVLAIANAVRENKGLVELSLLYRFIMNDETWGAVCDSVKTHPKIEELDLLATFRHRRRHPPVAPDVMTSRMQTLLDMMRVNTSIRRIGLDSRFTEHDIYRDSVIPYLKTNRLRSLLLAIQRTHPITYRAKILGRALLTARYDVNLFWLLLSGNAEVAFPSTAVTTTRVANLPTPAIVDAFGSANAAPAVAGRSTAAASNVDFAAPTAGQKRKAGPLV